MGTGAEAQVEVSLGGTPHTMVELDGQLGCRPSTHRSCSLQASWGGWAEEQQTGASLPSSFAFPLEEPLLFWGALKVSDG